MAETQSALAYAVTRRQNFITEIIGVFGTYEEAVEFGMRQPFGIVAVEAVPFVEEPPPEPGQGTFRTTTSFVW